MKSILLLFVFIKILGQGLESYEGYGLNLKCMYITTIWNFQIKYQLSKKYDSNLIPPTRKPT